MLPKKHLSEIALPYGKGTVPCPMGTGWHTIEPPASPPCPKPEDLLRHAILNPVCSRPLPEMLSGCRKITVAVSDATRKTGFPHFAQSLLNVLDAAGVSRDNIHTVVACGTHRPPTEKEYEYILGPLWPKSNRTYNACDDSPSYVHVGTTSRGTPVHLNRLAVETDLLLVVGEAKYHYFAGFGGGRKSILPGLSSRTTIRANHKFSLSPDGESTLAGPCSMGRLDGNPLSEDMEEATTLLPAPHFMINSIVDPHGVPVFMVGGDIIHAFRAICGEIRTRLEAPIPHTFDIVIASAGGWPSDINPIQAHKSFDFSFRATKPGGAIILVAEIGERAGFETLQKWLAHPTRIAHSKALWDDFDIYGRTALAWREKSEIVRVYLVSALSAQDTEILRMTKSATVAEAYCSALTHLGLSDPMVAVMPRASATLPVLAG
ncbi:MAG: nickel-dependent lactate racemase [Candidatus Brocadiia bacterium]